MTKKSALLKPVMSAACTNIDNAIDTDSDLKKIYLMHSMIFLLLRSNPSPIK